MHVRLLGWVLSEPPWEFPFYGLPLCFALIRSLFWMVYSASLWLCGSVGIALILGPMCRTWIRSLDHLPGAFLAVDMGS